MDKSRVSFLSAFIRKYIFNELLPLEARVGNMIYLVGLGSAFTTMVTRMVMGSNIFLVLVILAINLTIIGVIFLANYLKLYRIFQLIIVSVLCFVLFPLGFFALGGIDSAMAGYFVLSIVLIFLLTSGKSRIIFLVAHILEAVACYYFGSRPPLNAFVLPTANSYRYLDHIQTFVVVGICIGLIIAFQNKLYDEERQKVSNAKEDLSYRDRLLRVVNQVAEMLLSSETEYLDKTIKKAMEIMAGCVDADRMYIWKNRTIDGILNYEQQYEWLNNGVADMSLKAETGKSYTAAIPGWEENFTESRQVNGPVSGLSEAERIGLSLFGIKSILAIPVYLQEQFWGFVSFDDCHRERVFSEDDVNILRSGSLLLASAVVRNNNDIILSSRLKQQELMSDISQSFISKEAMGSLIQEALRRMGEFLKVTRVLVAVADLITDESRPAYTWFSRDEWKPDPTQTGFNEAITTTFPKTMPEKGYVPTVYCADTLTDNEGKYRIFYEKVGIKSFIWAPLYVDSSYWGMISIEECETARVWSDSDAQLVGTVSSAIAGAIARDIMEKARSAALDQAVQASKAKGDFLSNMSHEMRTPMNAIIGMTSIGKSAPDIEKKDYAFGKIEDASSHLLGVINDILDMSKIEANKLELSPVTFEFEKMLQKVVNVINFRIEQRQQSFYVTIDKMIPNSLIGDDQRLAQVITNLLSNAVKFTPEQGTIRLNAHYAGEENGLCLMQIEVTDSGIGISPEQQARLFTSFEQAESSTTRQFGGTGLGLAISKRIVELMGGKIWIESELGKGATFAFTVKMQKGDIESKSFLDPGVNWSNVKILAVDDESEILQYFIGVAENFGVKCDVASGSEEALALIKEKGGYDIYFIDWKMPGMNGMELSKRIKETGSGKSVVTMISGVEWSAIEGEAKSAGVDKFIAKPLFPSAIADLINECLGVDNAAIPSDITEDQDGCFEGFHLLLAEDVEINREIVLTLLESTKLLIDCAENGAIAVDMFRENPDKYDMIFMDVQMPQMDGYEATRTIRAMDFEKARGIPIVAMTANVFREDIEKSLAAGMNDHVGKPLDFNEVIARLRKYLPKNKTGNSAYIKYGEAGEESEQWKNGIAWSQDLATGNAEIDSQHKQIFRLTSNLAEASKNGQDAKFLKETLEFLINYTVKHFSDEEALASRYSYPDYRDHKKLHDDFRITVTQLSAEYDTKGSSQELWDKVTTTVVHWVIQHIKQQDFKLAEFIRKTTL
ncbi:bacteriohemerythrin [Treponema primitia]